MKVLAPDHVVVVDNCTTTSGEVVSLTCPLDGVWKPYDDFFIQASRGHHINDVVHAKVVGYGGMKRSTAAHFVNGRRCPDACRGKVSFTGYEVICQRIDASKVVTQTKLRYPNYKGKKKVQPRLFTYHERIPRSFWIQVSLPSAYNHYMPSARLLFVTSDKIYNPNRWPRYKGARQVFTASVQISSGARLSWSVGGGYSGSDSKLRTAFGNVVSLGLADLMNDYTNPVQIKTPLEDVTDAFVGYFFTFANYLCDAVEACEGWATSVYWPQPTSPGVETLPQLRDFFLLDEPEVIGERIDPLLLGKDLDFSNYTRNSLAQHALLSACESFPKLSDNSISNIMEIVGFVKSLVIDREIAIPKSLSDAWLSYRYVYQTTSMDVKDAVKFVRRRMNIGDLASGLTCRGTAHDTYKDTPITCRCGLDIKPRNLPVLDRVLRALDTYGLSPDFYVIWDSIPFSFIVDWFLPISDILTTLDADSKYFSGEFYNLENLCYSLSYTRDYGDDFYRVGLYSRWAGSVPSSLNSLYWLDAPSASSRTVGYRILDAASLFIFPHMGHRR